MIRSFADKDTKRLFERESVRRFRAFERVALRRLLVLDAAETLADLKGPGFSLEALKKDRQGQHSVRINDRWRLCFVWRDGDAHDVVIVDYH
jgi:proteic killer suppression protein